MGYPPLYAYFKNGLFGLFGYVRGDALLYLTIARYSANADFYTFDGETATNGFHPLWQYFLTLVFRVLQPSTPQDEQLLSLVLSMLAVVTGLVLANLAIFRYTRSIFLSLLTIPGVYYLIMGVLFANQPIWERVDGMESGFSILFGGGLLYLLAHRLASNAEGSLEDLARPSFNNVMVRAGLVLPFVILSRLDDFFLLFGFAGVILIVRGTLVDKFKTIVLMGLPSVVAILAYLVYNQLTVGAAMPLSGASKSGVSLFSSAYIYVSGMFPPMIDVKNALVTRQSDGATLAAAMFRPVQNITPVLIALGYALLVRTYYRDRPRFVVPVAFVIYVCLKGAYNIVNVNLWHQGTWYWAFTMLLCSYWLAILLSHPYYRALTRHPVPTRIVQFFYALFVLFACGSHIMSVVYGEQSSEAFICKHREEISRVLEQKAPGAGLLEFDDGVLNFCLEQSALHGFAFATDSESHRAYAEGRLMHHAYARGYSILGSEGSYIRTPEWIDSSDEIRTMLQNTFLEEEIKEELNDFDFEMLYIEVESQTAFILFTPKKATVAGVREDR